ncbi:hypothetical protein [Catellatospora sichuanensis]|uniref:hypothetical protein n=1 Tax=Catellatospora sichuanensis TaxID=1969805 RepID=UPI0011833EC3|nr:hypothetical protein [Catellatospora sichuanensis]
MALHRLRAARFTLGLTAVDTIDAASVVALIRGRLEAELCHVILTIAGPSPQLAEAMRMHARAAPAVADELPPQDRTPGFSRCEGVVVTIPEADLGGCAVSEGGM